MADASSLYDTLGIQEDASPDEIRAAYRRLAQVHHPDKGGNEEVFKAVSKAYEILSDPEKRRLYDAGELRPDGQREPSEPEMAELVFKELIRMALGRGGNLIRVMAKEIAGHTHQAKLKESDSRRKRVKLEAKLKKISFKGKGKNLITQEIEAQIAGLWEQESDAARAQRLLKLVEGLIKDYEDQEEDQSVNHAFHDSMLEDAFRAFGIKKNFP